MRQTNQRREFKDVAYGGKKSCRLNYSIKGRHPVSWVHLLIICHHNNDEMHRRNPGTLRPPSWDSNPALRWFDRAKVGRKLLPQAELAAATDKTEAVPQSRSKISGVIELLQRSEGATLDEMVTATGWLAHTTRAALTGLKKKGHVIARGKRGDITCYFLTASAA